MLLPPYNQEVEKARETMPVIPVNANIMDGTHVHTDTQSTTKRKPQTHYSAMAQTDKFSC